MRISLLLPVGALAALALSGLAAACSSSPSTTGSGSGSGTTTTTPHADAGAAATDARNGTDGGGVGDASDAADAADASTVVSDGCELAGSSVDAGAPTCDPATAWAAGVDLSVSTGAGESLVSVTADELTIAWLRLDYPATIAVADRASASAPFGGPVTVTGFDPKRGTVSADGLTITGTIDNGTTFVEATRATRGSAFAAPQPGAFAAWPVLTGDETYSDPVVSSDGLHLVYVHSGAAIADPVFASARAGVTDPWPAGTPMTSCALASFKGNPRHPTGLSRDLRTLFVYDEGANQAYGLWRDSATGPWNVRVALPGIANAAPNLDCSRLYYNAFAAGTGQDLFVASRP